MKKNALKQAMWGYWPIIIKIEIRENHTNLRHLRSEFETCYRPGSAMERATLFVDKVPHLRYIRGVMGSLMTPAPFFTRLQMQFPPPEQLEFTFVRSSGPGGQNVNKVSSKAQLRWNPRANAKTTAKFTFC